MCASYFAAGASWRKAVLLGSVLACSASVRAQSADPDALRKIIAEKNAEAARETWGDRPESTPLPSPSFGSPSGASQPSGSSDASASGASASAASIDHGRDVKPSEPPRLRAYVPQPAYRPADLSAGVQPLHSTAAAVAPPATIVVAPLPASGALPAMVSYTNGLLSVSAENSSLNAILREISRLTGMVVEGGVADDRVFGQYGPSSPSAVVNTLLQGSAANIFLRQGPHATVTRLILTARQP